MAWNGPVDGSYDNCDFTKAPWVAECAELTHEEVMFVIEALPPIEAEFLPDTNMVIGKYNQLTAYEKAINGQTYPVIKQYNPEINLWGIEPTADGSGRIVPDPNAPVEETEEPIVPIEGE